MGWPLIWPKHPPAKLNNSRQNHRAYGRFLKSWLVVVPSPTRWCVRTDKSHQTNDTATPICRILWPPRRTDRQYVAMAFWIADFGTALAVSGRRN
jgi:hypothetical protein